MSVVNPQTSSADSERAGNDRDEGAALVLVLVLILVSTLIVLPMLNYAIAVTRASRLVDEKAQRIEAAKGGLRVALSDPVELYKSCAGTGPNAGLQLASPQFNIPVSTKCYLMRQNVAEDDTKRPYGVAAIQAGTVLPAYFASLGNIYPLSGNVDEVYWRTNDTSLTRTQNTIWMPNLPSHALSPRSPTPYNMPVEFGDCLVYFPGTYSQPMTIAGPKPVYFTSGIYYFEDAVTITGDANVVVGGGSTDGCTTDQEAVFYAENVPSTHNITGLGATFVFGMQGRLAINNSQAGSAIRIVFNQRYVNTDDVNNLPSASVNIISVNGELPGNDVAATLVDLARPGVISVPMSLAPGSDGTFLPANTNSYRPSTLIPLDPLLFPPPADSDPIIDIALTAATPVTIDVPGYVSVAQGRFRLSIDAGLGTNKSVDFRGGVLARSVEIPGDNPATFSMGVFEVVVQLVLRIKTETTNGNPKVTSDAIVQVNKNGAYAVNSWSVQ